MTQPDSGLSKARPEARLFRVWMAAAGALAVLPVLRSWQLTRDGDTAATTLAIFAGAAWQIGERLPRIEARPRPLTRRLALLALGLGMWQLAWIGTDDFWFLRVAFVIWAAAWLALAWGAAGWIWGWRILAAFTLWGWFCDSPWQWSRDAYQTGDAFGPALAVVTAKVAGEILALFSASVQVSHQFLKLGAYTVSVGVPCTALPLVKLLWLLLALATLLLRLSVVRACWLAIAAALIAFAISVGRVMLLAASAGKPEQFHYWHDPDRGGVGWFTAAAMLLLAFLFARQFFSQRLGETESAPERALPPPPDPRWLLAAAALAWLLALIPFGERRRESLTAPGEENLRLQSDLKNVSTATGPLQPNQPAWTRELRYVGPQGKDDWTVVIAYLPLTLQPDPREQPALDSALPAAGRWLPLSTGGFFAPAPPDGRAACLATVAPGLGALGADPKAWTGRQRIAGAGPLRLARWLLHRSPLRTKRSYWLAVWGGSASNGSPPKLFSDWIALLNRAG